MRNWLLTLTLALGIGMIALGATAVAEARFWHAFVGGGLVGIYVSFRESVR